MDSTVLNLLRFFKILLTMGVLQHSLHAQDTLNENPQVKSSSTKFMLVTEINHPYVYYKNNSEELTGIAYEMVIELLKRANIETEVLVMPWLRAIRRVKNGDNACLFIMNRTVEREASYQWVGPMILGHLALYKTPDSPIIINQISDIKNYKVIGKLDGLALKDLQSMIDINPILTSSDEQSAKLLYRGRGDLWTTGDIDGPMAVSTLGLAQPVLVLQRGETVLSMGCSLKLDPTIFEKLTAAHDSMTDRRKQIIEKYLLNPLN